MIPFTTKPSMRVEDTYVVWRVSRKATPKSIFFSFYFIIIEIKIYKAISKLISKNCDYQIKQTKVNFLFFFMLPLRNRREKWFLDLIKDDYQLPKFHMKV